MTGDYELSWTLANELDLIFVIVFQKLYPVLYAQSLLQLIRDRFLALSKESSNEEATKRLSDEFDTIVRDCEAAVAKSREDGRRPKSGSGKMPSAAAVDQAAAAEPAPPVRAKSPVHGKVVPAVQPSPVHEGIPRSSFGKRRPSTKPEKKPSVQALPKGKQSRVWNEASNANIKLDYSDEPSSQAPARDDVIVPAVRAGDLDALDDAAAVDSDEEDEVQPSAAAIAAVAASKTAAAGSAKPAKHSLGSRMFSLFRNVTGTRVLTKDDLIAPLKLFEEGLVAKNVAANVAEKLCDSVKQSLADQTMETYTVRATVKKAIEQALTRILTPRNQIDVLRDALAAQAAHRPYSIVFCGVNGVGKSTSLAKVAHWLVGNNLSVSIAACDTFRAGAVEQLRTHVTRLSQQGHPVQLFERGYGRDPAQLAGDAIRAAKASGTNVVLIDTAGRMQDNEPLMRVLADLVGVNQPDLVLFVGEALVGNDAVDQLMKFNRALVEYGSSENSRGLDGIVLTKFDTIDDKVGAAVSMVYNVGAPIVFVGTGQQYYDLKKLNVGAVVKALLS
eukprot:TRINITY_DN13312_c0_g1_i1.p1 TRINITY_DN13312_c0_g1~~TRINITY_DN13312_c0_g1_i1.p1  ORF type:complete len:625 (+),score=144.97 TRINITY_DN13312_c0_g1_i1:203-1876(+)